MHPTVIQFYSTKTLLAGVINASYFETEGWNAPQHNYEWTFDPSSGWNNMSAGRVMISFEGDEKRTGCFLKDLLAHNLKITPPAGWAGPPPYTPPSIQRNLALGLTRGGVKPLPPQVSILVCR